MTHGTARQVSAAEWNALLSNSVQNTHFLEPALLERFGVEYHFWGLERSGLIIAGMPIIDASSYGGRYLPWCYYQGLVFHREIWRAAPAKRTQYEIELSEQLVTEVAKYEEEIVLSLHLSLQDVRGLDWVHYHSNELQRVSIFPRYTAVVELEGATNASLSKACRSARRQEFGYAIKRENLTATHDGTMSELKRLFIETFERQGVVLQQKTVRMLTPYADYFCNHANGELITVRSANGVAQAIALVFTDYDGTVHVPIVGSGETRFGGTLLYFEILSSALAAGARRVDFNGANSPKRAYFKHSMGASPMLYFEAHWKKQRA